MARVLLFLVLAFLVWLAVRTLGGSRKRRDLPRASEPAAAPDRFVETIRQCAWCGVHVPAADVVSLPDGRIYCSVAHRDAARQVAGPDERSRS